MADLTLTLSDFRAQFPTLATASDATIILYWELSTDFISANNYGYLNGTSRQFALYLMTAHLMQLANNAAISSPNAPITSATEGSVSVGFMPPPSTNAFSFWCNSTSFGQQLLALLQVKAAFGFYTAGSRAPQGNIRKANGTFGR